MEISEADRKQILKDCLRIIDRLCDIEYLRKAWIRGEDPNWVDYDEIVCTLSPELDWILEKYKYFFVSDIQCLILKEFRDEFDAFKDTTPMINYHHDFIESREWKRVMESGKDVLEVFKYKKTL